jgi:DNA-binding MarR family transcriptional regulator
MDYDALKLSNQLCFPLYACAKEVVRKYKPMLDEINLTYTQYIVMMVLWERKEVAMKELCDTLYLDSGTITPLLKKMESQGLLQRKRDDEDERHLIITITPQGQELREKAASIPEKMGRCINMPPDEIKTLYGLLYKVLGNL